MKRRTKVLLSLVVLAVIGTSGYFGFRSTRSSTTSIPSVPPTVSVASGDVQQTVSAPGQLATTRRVDLTFGVDGRLAKVTAHPGDSVRKGDVLAQLETSDLERTATKAELSLRQAKLRLEQLQNPADEAKIHHAKGGMNQAAFMLVFTQIKLLISVLNSIWLDALGDAQSAVGAWYTYKEAQEDLQQLQRGTAPADLEAAQLDVEKAQLDVEKAHNDLEKAVLVAPFDGVVLEVNAAPGDRISTSTTLITLIDPAAVEDRTTVVEEDLPLVQVDQPAELFFDAQPAIAVQGHVSRIVPQRVPGQDRPLYSVYIALDELPKGLVPGMTVDASIIITKRTSVLRLPRALVHAGSGGTTQVEVWKDGHAEKRTIRVGLRGDVYIEILGGLREGEQVIGQ